MRCGEVNAAAGLRLFGVQLRAAGSPASQHLHNRSSLASLLSPPLPSSLLLSIDDGCDRAAECNLSDDPHGVATTRDMKKGVPWSEEEHQLFLAGLEKLGKGDWRGISRSFVTTRTPTQVASHAQKFFLRQNSTGKKTNKRRSSLFDMVQDGESRTSLHVSDPASHCMTSSSASPSLKLSHDRASVSEAAHVYGSHHCSPLDIELGISLSTPSIGTLQRWLDSRDPQTFISNILRAKFQPPSVLLLNLIDNHGDRVVDKVCNLVILSYSYLATSQ
ncbi:hypothetical protein GUJ93_ZPchr0005g15943 [Zizania palustris]|uniref:Uncharacterized protein n=1 Tax=Zizania palustris TaxID=103762 RepID=A0A8J5W1Z0_ZIZPA|nr:hypothetical protein GUJ93_ZPchr0005g15943 [Zizania palustris]